MTEISEDYESVVANCLVHIAATLDRIAAQVAPDVIEVKLADTGFRRSDAELPPDYFTKKVA